MHTANNDLTRKSLDGVAEMANATETQAGGSSEFLLKHSVLGGRHDSVLAEGTAVRPCLVMSSVLADVRETRVACAVMEALLGR